MTKNIFGSFGLASVIVATALVGFDTQLAMACSSGSSGSGLSHGSSLGSGSVTVCVGSSGGSSGSSSTQTITKTVQVKVPIKAKPAPAPKKVSKVASKPAPKVTSSPAPVSCPSSQQLASVPRSADAAERWIGGACSSSAKAPALPKPAPKVSAKPKQKYEIRTITETITIESPGSSFANSDEVDFYPNQLKAVMAPGGVLGIGQQAAFSSNPSSHYGISQVLGRQAQVHFVPVASGWFFSDGAGLVGSDASRSFKAAGKYQATAWVGYQVSYRLVGESSWQPVEGELSIESNTLEILVGASFLKGDEISQGALLVGEDCRSRAGAFGCGI